MKFIIIVLILILFNIIIFIFSDKQTSNRIINYFELENEENEDTDIDKNVCAFEHMKPDSNSETYDRTQCINRCKIFYLENDSLFKKCIKDEDLEQLETQQKQIYDEICERESHCPEKTDIIDSDKDDTVKVVKYIPQGDGKIKLKFLSDSFKPKFKLEYNLDKAVDLEKQTLDGEETDRTEGTPDGEVKTEITPEEITPEEKEKQKSEANNNEYDNYFELFYGKTTELEKTLKPLTVKIYIDHIKNNKGRGAERKYLEANYIPAEQFSYRNLNKLLQDNVISNREYELILKEIVINSHPNLVYIGKEAFKEYTGSLQFKGVFPKLSYIGKNSFSIDDVVSNLVLDLRYVYTLKFLHQDFLLNEARDKLISADRLKKFRIYFTEEIIDSFYKPQSDNPNNLLSKLATDSKTEYEKDIPIPTIEDKIGRENSIPIDLLITDNSENLTEDLKSSSNVCDYNDYIFGFDIEKPLWCGMSKKDKISNYIENLDETQDIHDFENWEWKLEFSPRLGNEVHTINLGKTSDIRAISEGTGIIIGQEQGLVKNQQYIFILKTEMNENKIVSLPQTIIIL